MTRLLNNVIENLFIGMFIMSYECMYYLQVLETMCNCSLDDVCK